ncbi:MAG TPA: phosphodiester glycosidase family protein [Allosphingosinicella sp.]|nr:phosphodiester glycosidase family protein [Allosphingosinicella sp.]
MRSSLEFLAAALLLAGCQAHSAPDQARATSACTERTFEGTRFTACRYDARRDEIRLIDADAHGPLRSFARLKGALGRDSGRLLFAMNAGMFDPAGLPVGLSIEQGVEKHRINRRSGGSDNFSMQPNGVFAADGEGHVAIVPSGDWPPANFRARWATQSGPMLVIAGKLHPKIQPNGTALNIRNGVGVDGRDTAWFVISDQPVSFGRLARFFRDELGCPNALYFDGAISSLWEPAAGREDSAYALGPMVAVLKRR